jgi:hypothetical protein
MFSNWPRLIRITYLEAEAGTSVKENLMVDVPSIKGGSRRLQYALPKRTGSNIQVALET